MKNKTRTLFSVVEVVGEGSRYCQVDWHPNMSAILDEVSPNAELTDKLIDIAEELLEDEDRIAGELK